MKYYAVRKGKVPGIYESWEECSEQTYKVPGAVFKSFEHYEEAETFMNEEDNTLETIDLSTLSTYAFIDGSFNPTTNVYGCGGFIIHKENDEERRIIIQDSGEDEELVIMRNIAGELLGVVRVIEKALEEGYNEITIFYDYQGIEMWATGLWDCNKEATRNYQDFCQSIKDKITLHFVKVKGHIGIDGNEEADRLAKDAVGVK